MQTQLYSDVIVWVTEKDKVTSLDRRDSRVNTDGEWVKTLPVEVLKTSLILKVALRSDFVFLKNKKHFFQLDLLYLYVCSLFKLFLHKSQEN